MGIALITENAYQFSFLLRAALQQIILSVLE